MACLYLVGFAAPAFEAATRHVGEMKDPARSLPRAVFASGAMAGLFFIILPLVWLSTIGTTGMWRSQRHARADRAPLLAGVAKSGCAHTPRRWRTIRVTSAPSARPFVSRMT